VRNAKYLSRKCHHELMSRSRWLIPVLLVAGCLATLGAAARSGGAPTDAISIGGLERRLRFIASDALEGRESLSPGFRVAAEYLASELAGLGLTPRGDDGSFLQRVTMRRTVVDSAATKVELAGHTFVFGADLLASGTGSATGRVVYVGHGYRIPSKEIDPYAGMNVKDAILLVLSGTPPDVTSRDLRMLEKGTDWWGPEDNARALGARGVIRVAGHDERSDWQRAGQRQTSRGVLVVDRLTPEQEPLPVVTAGPRLLAALLSGERESGTRLYERVLAKDAGTSFALTGDKRVTLTVGARVAREDTFNVVASVEGTDPVLRAEFIALGAHLDHIGLRPARTGSSGATADRSERPGRTGSSGATADKPAPQDLINNGADDDGSGVVALMEMAAAAMRGPPPKRSLLFVWHTGEESGGWGARYITAFPPVPIEGMIAQLNLDMIGRSRRAGDGTAANAALTGPDELYVVGASRVSRALADTIATANREYLNLTLNQKYDDPADPERIFERSDHYHYAQKGIPVAFFFSGLHEDYHRPSDEIDSIDFVKLQKIARTVLAVAWTLGNAPDRPALDAAPRQQRD
jgi:Peptidase family M28